MVNSTSNCNGGLIRFIPFQDTDWIGRFFSQSFQHIQIQIVVVIFIIALFLFLLLILKLCYKRQKHLSHCDSTSIRSGPNQSETSLELHYFKTQDYDWVDELWPPELQVPKKTRWKKIDSHFNILPTEDSLSFASEIKPLSKVYTRRITILSIVSALFVVCLVGHVASLVIAIRSEQNLISMLNAVPVQLHLISQNAVKFVRFSMDIAFNISIAHILNDAHRTDNGSYLQGFVSQIKVLVSQVVTCLAYNCFNSTENQPISLKLLPLENTSRTDLENHRNIAQHLLNSFELAIKRFENLNKAAQNLNPKTIQEIQNDWYEYRRDVSTLVPNNPILTGSVNQQNWTSYDLVRQTRNLLCNYLNHSGLDQFDTCNQVETYLDQLIQYANQLPFMMPSKRLDSVITFTLIPRALNVEHLVNQWMPVLYDLPGKGLVLLLDTFLKPEMNKGELQLKQLIKTFPPNELTSQLSVYTRYINSAIIILFVLFISLAVIICLVYLILFSRHWNKLHKCRKFLANWNRFNHNTSDFYHLLKIPTGCRSPWPLVGLIIFGSITMILTSTSLGLVYASALTKIELCDILVNPNQCTDQSDKILTQRLELTASTISQLISFLAIDKLNIKYPQHILTTLNNPYRNGQKSLLDQIEMTKPVNFTALLEAQWTLDQIRKAWNKDVTEKLNQENLKSKIPQLNVTQIYEKTAQTLNLAKSFDDLEVGQITDYLNDPGSNWFAKLQTSLKKIPNEEAQKLSQFYEQLNKHYSNYLNLYLKTKTTLKQIDENKALLQVINILIQTGSQILYKLNYKTNQQLVDLIDQFLPTIFPQLKPLGEKYIIPFIENILVDMIPYYGLNEIYIQTMGLVCPLSVEQSSTSIQKPIVGEIQTMSISMTSLGITLLLLCLISSVLF